MRLKRFLAGEDSVSSVLLLIKNASRESDERVRPSAGTEEAISSKS